jgi:hypothetical protein
MLHLIHDLPLAFCTQGPVAFADGHQKKHPISETHFVIHNEAAWRHITCLPGGFFYKQIMQRDSSMRPRLF